MPKSKLVELYGSCIFSFFKNQPKCFPEWLFRFTFLPVLCKQFSFPHPCQHLVLSLFLKPFIFGWAGSLLLHLGFLWLLWVEASLPCCTQASHCGSYSCCGAWALATGPSVVAAPGFSSCGTHGLIAPWRVGSPRPGIKPVSPALQRGFLTLDHQGSPK